MVVIRVFGVSYDTEADGVLHQVDLPEELEVEIDSLLDADGQPVDLEAEISGAISDATGWCVKSFDYEVIGSVTYH